MRIFRVRVQGRAQGRRGRDVHWPCYIPTGSLLLLQFLFLIRTHRIQSAMSDMGERGVFIMLAAVVCWTILAVEGMIDYFCLFVKCEDGRNNLELLVAWERILNLNVRLVSPARKESAL